MKTLIVLSIISALSLSIYDTSDKSKSGTRAAYYNCSDSELIDNVLFTPEEEHAVHFVFDLNRSPDTTKLNYLNWHRQTDYGYFTAYLVNTTDTTFNAKRQDGSLIMIQEAKNKDGEWQPIEHWIYSGCGNSYFNPLALEPNSFAEVGIIQYTGSFETQLRLKLKYGTEVLYSAPFRGSIDPSQMKKETDPVNGILFSGPAAYLDVE